MIAVVAVEEEVEAEVVEEAMAMTEMKDPITVTREELSPTTMITITHGQPSKLKQQMMKTMTEMAEEEEAEDELRSSHDDIHFEAEGGLAGSGKKWRIVALKEASARSGGAGKD